jgi:hypothetical protein
MTLNELKAQAQAMNASEPFVGYMQDMYKLVMFDRFVLDLIVNGQKTTNLAESFVETIARMMEPAAWFDLAKELPHPATEMKKHEELFAEMLLCRMVDSFLSYISDLLTVIFKTRPEMLKSNDTVTINYLFEHKTMDELIHSLVERKVHSLSFKGFRDLNDYLVEKVGLVLAESSYVDTLVMIIEMRNILVHNRGLINRIFCERVPQYSDQLGMQVVVGYSRLYTYLKFLFQCVELLDKRANDKFALPIWPNWSTLTLSEADLKQLAAAPSPSPAPAG